MSEEAKRNSSRAVVVVGVDLSDVSAHLVTTARDLVRTVDDPELHVVHVVRPESLRERLAEPVHSVHSSERAQMQSAQWQLDHLCESIVQGSGARWFVHTPVGDAADQLTALARKLEADVILVEAPDHPSRSRLFHRSAVARILQSAPCTVMAIRQRVASAAASSAGVAATTGN